MSREGPRRLPGQPAVELEERSKLLAFALVGLTDQQLCGSLTHSLRSGFTLGSSKRPEALGARHGDKKNKAKGDDNHINLSFYHQQAQWKCWQCGKARRIKKGCRPEL